MKRPTNRNARIKHRYFAYLEEARRMAPVSVDQVAAALAAFERSTGGKDFAAFHIEQARKFKRDLATIVSQDTGRLLSKATIRSRLMAVKGFFFWLADQPGYRSKVRHADCDYFNPSANDARIATARRPRATPTLEQALHAMAKAPAGSALERRDRALMAFALLTGMRDAALASLPIDLVDLGARSVFQDARRVRTKNAKTMTTWFFPVGGGCEAIVADWIDELTTVHLFGPDDPMFPATLMGLNDDGQFAAQGLSRDYWTTAAPIRRIFKERFEAAGLPYFHPHSLRRTLARLGQTLCRTPEELKAWSQNLGHEDVLTTFTSYGAVDPERQAALMRGFAAATPATDPGAPDPGTVKQVLAWLGKQAG
jgi:integrase